MTIKDGIKFSFGIYIGFATISVINALIKELKSDNNQETKTTKDTEEK